MDKAHPDYDPSLPHFGLPAEARRTQKEHREFQHALENMHLLYTLRLAKIVILPKVPNGSFSNRAYIDRGWCFFELAISASFSTIENNNDESVVQTLSEAGLPLSVDKFQEAFESKHFTARGDRDHVRRLYRILRRNEFRARSCARSCYRLSQAPCIVGNALCSACLGIGSV